MENLFNFKNLCWRSHSGSSGEIHSMYTLHTNNFPKGNNDGAN